MQLSLLSPMHHKMLGILSDFAVAGAWLEA